MMSGRASPDELASIMNAGADDYLVKPPTITQLRARVRAALRLKAAQDRSDRLNRDLLALNHDLESALHSRDSDLVHARNALVLALAEIVNYRDTETGSHLLRLQHYCSSLSEEARQMPSFGTQVDRHFVEMLGCCAPLHDIGKVGLPDHILLKPGKLSDDERKIMQTHTTMGAETLEKVARKHGFARSFLQMGIEVARHHHERFDGRGYPDQLAGDSIPLSARIVAIADVYDALRSARVYKPAFSHERTVQIMIHESPGHFDPALLDIFSRCAFDFDRIHRECQHSE
jgi:response regulator RpfG family c-di-GMP phosphodiesterase